MWDYLQKALTEFEALTPLNQIVLLSGIPLIAIAGAALRFALSSRDRTNRKKHSPKPPQRILLVDDDPRILEAMQSAIQQAGYATDAYENPEIAVVAFREKGADLVIVDGAMFPLGGPGVLRHLRAIDPQVPVILITSFVDTFPEETNLISGFDDYLTKPFEMPVLLARIAARLRGTQPTDSKPSYTSKTKTRRVGARRA